MNLLAALLMCFLGFMTSVQHKKIFGIFFLVFSVMWTVGGTTCHLVLLAAFGLPPFPNLLADSQLAAEQGSWRTCF